MSHSRLYNRDNNDVVPVSVLEDCCLTGQLALKCSTDPHTLHPPPAPHHSIVCMWRMEMAE